MINSRSKWTVLRSRVATHCRETEHLDDRPGNKPVAPTRDRRHDDPQFIAGAFLTAVGDEETAHDEVLFCASDLTRLHPAQNDRFAHLLKQSGWRVLRIAAAPRILKELRRRRN
jgi:hypothetical protein